MKLHDNPNEFQELITLTAQEKHIPESAVERDYYIVRALLYLSQSSCISVFNISAFMIVTLSYDERVSFKTGIRVSSISTAITFLARWI